MIISYYGEGCFKIQNGEIVILTDPISPQSGLTTPRFKTDIILKTLTPFPIDLQPITDGQRLIYGPGEYNIKEINILGLANKKESAEDFLKTVYLIKADSLKICVLGHLAEAPEPDIAKYLEEIDILFIPAGGNPFINQEAAVKLIKNIEPKIVIPSFYKIPGLKRKSDDLKIFLEEINHGKHEPQEKLTVKKKDLDAIKKTELKILSKF